MSFANMTLYNAVIPQFHSKRRGGGGRDGGGTLRADDPRNNDRVLEAIGRMT